MIPHDISTLPYSITIHGVEYPIATEHRDIRDVLIAYNAKELSPYNKHLAMLEIIYGDNIPADINEAGKAAIWFIDGGAEKKNSNGDQSYKTLDYEQDWSLLISAVNKVAGYDLRNPDIITHWWTFLSFCGAIDANSMIAHIVHIRHKRATGKKLEKHEQEFYRENKHLIDFKTDVDPYEVMMRQLRGD